ncbi:MAG: hypothetical protein Q7T37_00680 [bacterium]|nr:hypothetical protein [bacterium]MDO8741932.1 hypothetical protein [bacterium]
MSLVAPAVLPTSHKDLEEKLALFGRFPHISRVQIDVVDGRFASPASWPYTAPTEFKSLIEHGKTLPFLDRISYEIDLMCEDAHRAADAWLLFGATRLTLHVESVPNFSQFLPRVRNYYGDLVSFGIALNVDTDLSLIEKNIDGIDYVQFMGIGRIGIQGQPFDQRVLERIRSFHRRYPKVPIQVDGGVTLQVAKQLLASGVSGLVVGSGILRAEDPVAAFDAFERLKSPFGV